MLSNEDIRKLTKALSAQQNSSLDEGTKISLGHVITIVIAVFSSAMFLAGLKFHLDDCVSMVFMRQWATQMAKDNPALIIPDPDAIARIVK